MDKELLKKIVYVEAEATSEYTGNEFYERFMMTVDDFVKYFYSEEDTKVVDEFDDDNEDSDEDRLYSKLDKIFDDMKISINNLDRLHSETGVDVSSEVWDNNAIIKGYDRYTEYESYRYEEGKGLIINKLCDTLGYTGSKRLDFEREIRENVTKVVEQLDYKKYLRVSVPRSKVEELMAFVDKLNNKEE